MDRYPRTQTNLTADESISTTPRRSANDPKVVHPDMGDHLGPSGIPSKCGDFHYEEMTWQIHEGSMTRSSGPVL